MNPWVCGFIGVVALTIVGLMIAITIMGVQQRRLAGSGKAKTPTHTPGRFRCSEGYRLASIGQDVICGSLTQGKIWRSPPTPLFAESNIHNAMRKCWSGKVRCNGVFQITPPLVGNPTPPAGFEYMKWYGVAEPSLPTVPNGNVGNVNLNVRPAAW